MDITLVTKDKLAEKFGSSFKGAEILATREELETLIGKENVGKSSDGKTFHEWFVQSGDKQFTIYDYKEGRNYPADETIHWHVGSKYDAETDRAFANEMRNLLKELRTKE